MNEYLIKVGFWLRAFDTVTVEAPDDAAVIAMAKAAAATIIESHAHPEAIDFDERREGSVSYIDRVDPDGRKEITAFLAFDDDRLHAPLHDFVERIARLPASAIDQDGSRGDALRQFQALIEEAKTLRAHVA
jgi:hypothetical protein